MFWEIKSVLRRLSVLTLVSAGLGTGCGEGLEEPAVKLEAAELGQTQHAVNFNGHDYLFVTTPVNWLQAQALCGRQGYRLVTIDDDNEEAFLDEQEASRGLNDWWIGYNDRASEGTFTWEGGSSGYTNWYPGEPNDAGGDEDCVGDRLRGNDGWNDYPCNNTYPFICERDSSARGYRGRFNYQASETWDANTNTRDYKVFLFAGQLFTVGTCGVPGSSGHGDTYLRLVDPWGAHVGSNDDGGGSCGQYSNLSIAIHATGLYTIRAGCAGNKSCRGTVAFSY